MEFVHLHVHSQYSLLDGHGSVKQLVKQAGELGVPAVAITDADTLSAAPELLREASRHPGLKPIVGCELHVTTPSGGPGGRIVLLAKDRTGYLNLLCLVSLAHIGSNDSPAVQPEMLKWFSKGLVCLSGGTEGEVTNDILAGEEERAGEVIRQYRSLFGDDFYLEVSPSMSNRHISGEERVSCSSGLIRLGRRMGVTVVATNEVRFARAEDEDSYRLLASLGRHKKGGTVSRYAFMMTGEEILGFFPDHPEVISNTLQVAGKIQFYDINQPLDPPAYPLTGEQQEKVHGWMRTYADIIDAGAHDKEGILRGDRFFESISLLCHLTYEGARVRYGKSIPEKRLRMELEAISAANTPDLFLICYDLVRWARENGIHVGPGRGSAPGSLVLYCLGITEVDPIRFGLLFERFMNPYGKTAPGLYIDIDKEGKDKVISYLAGKYGYEHLALVTAYGALTPESPLYDDCLKDVICMKGIHACAVILSGKGLTECVPLEEFRDKRSGNRFLLSQYSYSDLQNSGVMAMDLIGIETLSVTRECLSLVKQRFGFDIDLGSIPLDDPMTYALYRSGDTDGVFHFESFGMQALLRRMVPSRLEDLMILDALYRDGCLDHLMQLIDIKDGNTHAPSFFPIVDGILSETYGIIVYQEQVMEIAQKVAGFTPERSDGLRKALCRNDRPALGRFREEFIHGGLRNGHPKNTLEQLWDTWCRLGKIIFNKSHAAAYSLLSYRTAWLKAHFREEFDSARRKKNKK